MGRDVTVEMKESRRGKRAWGCIAIVQERIIMGIANGDV
jgi:hypothetical protein